MEQKTSSPLKQTLETWRELLRQFKENLAKRLWALPSVSEKEKEIVYREHLGDLDAFERQLHLFNEELTAKHHVLKEENELLRSLMGTDDDEKQTRNLKLGQDLSIAKKRIGELKEETDELKGRLDAAANENEELRKYIRESEDKADRIRSQHFQIREADIKAFSESHEGLKNQLKDLETRLKNLRSLFSETNQKMLIEKQDEISDLQKKLLTEMEETLRHRQELLWNEEELFAKGIAHKVRSALVSAQGQLFLTLERLGLMEPETKSESFWKARLRLLMEGGTELARNFKEVQSQLQDVTATLDDYLHLTHRREVQMESISLDQLVRKEMAILYVDRKPTLNLEVLSDDPLPDVYGDVQLLQFCFHTLIQNAIEALPNESGRVQISLKHKMKQKEVEILIQDEGQGIPEHLVDRLFQPFFTTKEGRQGLNLSRSRRYVELHGGTLEMVKTSPQGTLFAMTLPLRKV